MNTEEHLTVVTVTTKADLVRALGKVVMDEPTEIRYVAKSGAVTKYRFSCELPFSQSEAIQGYWRSHINSVVRTVEKTPVKLFG